MDLLLSPLPWTIVSSFTWAMCDAGLQILKACVVSTGREIPNKEIASINNLQDVVKVLQKLDQDMAVASANPKGHVVAEWFMSNKASLPDNMVFIPYEKSRGVKAEDRKRTNKRFL